MVREEIVIRGGKIVTPFYVKEADIWIANGKITRVAKDTMPKISLTKPPVELDATGMYLLPGFIAIPDSPIYRVKERNQYMSCIQNFIKRGCTSLVDTFDPEAWMNDSQIRYQQTAHFNSMIDYVWHVGIDARQLGGGEAARWFHSGYPSLLIRMRDEEDFSSINWETISRLHTSNKTILHLHVPPGSMAKEQRERLLQLWLTATRYWKLRTVLTDSTARYDLDTDSYYHIFRLSREWTERAMRQMHRHWFRNLPYIAPLHDIQFDVRRSWCSDEELLCLIVRLASANVAKAVGLYPAKGALLPGSDADIVFLKTENWLTKFDVSTILNFSETHLPTSVMSNGRWIYRDMRFCSSIGMGRRLFDTRPYSYVI
ncbi:dihydroorotate dehydrogenase [Brevibacillus sp. GCM10020057]|uniref:dihydroorotate dehydrogenase n=1 Tax=Brevibacillus sp. GCM10020057 TaxID=3317327 RepID=UPI003633EA7F